MRRDYEHVPTIPVKSAQEKANKKVRKATLIGATTASVFSGHWIAGGIIFIVLFGLNLWYTKDL